MSLRGCFDAISSLFHHVGMVEVMTRDIVNHAEPTNGVSRQFLGPTHNFNLLALSNGDSGGAVWSRSGGYGHVHFVSFQNCDDGIKRNFAVVCHWRLRGLRQVV